MKPSISIITAVFNGASTIADCLASVGAQTEPVEHIVVDGASSDRTVELVRAAGAGARVVSEPDSGIYHAMNKGIGLATGEVVGTLNADDFYAAPGVLAKVARLFQDPDVDALYGDLLYVSELPAAAAGPGRSGFRTVRYWKSGAFRREKFYWGWMPPHPTFFVRRRVYERYGLFDPELGTAADYELMLRFLLKHGVRAAYLPEILVKMRTGGASNARPMNRIRANLMDRKAWEMNGLTPYPWTLTMKPLGKIGQWFARPSGPVGAEPEGSIWWQSPLPHP